MSETTKPGDLRRSLSTLSGRSEARRGRSVIEPEGMPLVVRPQYQRVVKTAEDESHSILERDQRKLTTARLLQLARKTKKKSLTEPKKRRR